MSVNGVHSAGFGAVERRGNPGILAGNLPNQQVRRTQEQTPRGAGTDRNGNMVYSGGLHLETRIPTQRPSLPGDSLLAQVKGKHIDTRA